jgi:hypothetical protein
VSRGGRILAQAGAPKKLLDRFAYPGNHDGVLRRFLLLALIAIQLGLVPAAYADPPDPTWLSGYWDDNDFDNVVILIANTSAVEAPPLLDSRPRWATPVVVEISERQFVQASPRSAASPRAPPVVVLSAA